jgi:hypothetical protein
MAEQLKPCPFCGHSEVILDQGRHGVLCNFCQSDAPDGWWNQRTPGPATKDMLVWAKRMLVGVPDDMANPILTAFLAEWNPQVPE